MPITVSKKTAVVLAAGLLAGSAALGLGAGATSGFGLWSASDTVAGAMITSADLGISLKGDAFWADCAATSEWDGEDLIVTLHPLTDLALAGPVVMLQEFDMTLDAGTNANLDADLVVSTSGWKLPDGNEGYFAVVAPGEDYPDEDDLDQWTAFGEQLRVELNTGGTDPETIDGLEGWSLLVVIHSSADVSDFEEHRYPWSDGGKTGFVADSVNANADPLTGEAHEGITLTTGTFELDLEQTR